jgi:hypothetical protein
MIPIKQSRRVSMEMESRLMKEQAARTYLGGMGHGSFVRLRKEGQIRAIHIGKSLYFDRVDLDAFVESLREG